MFDRNRPLEEPSSITAVAEHIESAIPGGWEVHLKSDFGEDLAGHEAMLRYVGCSGNCTGCDDGELISGKASQIWAVQFRFKANFARWRVPVFELRSVLRLGVQHGEQTQRNYHDANALK